MNKNNLLTWAEVDLSVLARNMRKIRKKVGKNRKILVAVKSDAYGHGAVQVSKAALNNGADMLGVAVPEEAIELRKAGITAPILMLFPVLPAQSSEIVRYNIRQNICTMKLAHALSCEAKRQKKNVVVHIEIDTGMSRTGIQPGESVRFIKEINRLDNLSIEGIFTHFATADKRNKKFAKVQLSQFIAVIREVEKLGISIPLKHTANSAAILDLTQTYFNLVRPGLILYGMYPSSEVSRSIGVKPVLSLKSRVTFVKNVLPGRSISYGRRYITKKRTVIATVPIGYGDGYNRGLSNKGEVIIKSRRAPVVGTVCMDQTMVDVGNIPKVNTGDEVILIGRQGNQEISSEEIAKKLDTIPYEITCAIGKRVPRITKGQKVSGLES